MINNFIKSLKETTITIIPICLVVTIIAILFNLGSEVIGSFITSSVLLIIGISLFTFGADISMMLIGEKLGSKFMQNKSVFLILLISLLLGVAITIAEPDLKVLATQITSIPSTLLIGAVGLGVGIFLMMAVVKILLKWELRTILIVSYTLIFASLFFIPQDFIPMAFDSSGVTTGPMSVPFILALGVGFTMYRTDKSAKNDTFGLIALCSVGPIITVLLLGLLFNGTGSYDTSVFYNSDPLIIQYTHKLFECMRDIFISISPIIAIYLIFNIISKDAFSKRENKKIMLGFIITFIGLTLFLTGVNVGFMKTGYLLGESFVNSDFSKLIIPFGMIIGFLVVLVEPAVKILNSEIEELTEGSISKNIMQISLSIGVALAIALALLRVFTGISILYILIPGYILSIILSFLTPKIFTSIAFDSGGSVSGPLTATFILPFVIGACYALGGNIITDAFGLVALIAMSPLITIQAFGVIFKIKTKQEIYKDIDEEIFEYDWRNAL